MSYKTVTTDCYDLNDLGNADYISDDDIRHDVIEYLANFYPDDDDPDELDESKAEDDPVFHIEVKEDMDCCETLYVYNFRLHLPNNEVADEVAAILDGVNYGEV